MAGEDPDAWVEIARLGRVRGLCGEIFATGTQPADWYLRLPRVRIRLAGGSWYGSEGGGQPAEVQIAEARSYSGRLAMRFDGVDSASAAGPLVNGTVFLSREARPAAPDGESWLSDLVGCRVEDVRSSREVGRVTGWQDLAGPAVTLEVTPVDGGQPMLVPYVRAICVEVDLAGRRILIDPPEGLLDLNAAPAPKGPAGESAAGQE